MQWPDCKFLNSKEKRYQLAYQLISIVDGKKIRIPGHRLLSNRTVYCLTNVEVFSLSAADIEEVTSLFSRFLRNPRVQGAIR